MNLKVTIPQLFYDLIARIVPGFFFLKTWEVVFGYKLFISDFSGEHWTANTFSGIAFITICYLAGWLLSSPAAIIETWERPLKVSNYEDPNTWNFYQQYDWIRIVNDEVGFRIVKLRAEHRMLVSCLTGALVLLSALLISTQFGYFRDQNASLEIILLLPRICALVIMILAFIVLVRKMRKQYDRSVEQHFNLLRQMKREK